MPLWISLMNDIMDNYYQLEWERSTRGESSYIPRFFGWQEFYDKGWIEGKRKEFPNERMFLQEYPSTPDEAFVSSGTPYFDTLILKEMLNESKQPLIQGKILPDGEFLYS